MENPDVSDLVNAIKDFGKEIQKRKDLLDQLREEARQARDAARARREHDDLLRGSSVERPKKSNRANYWSEDDPDAPRDNSPNKARAGEEKATSGSGAPDTSAEPQADANPAQGAETFQPGNGDVEGAHAPGNFDDNEWAKDDVVDPLSQARDGEYTDIKTSPPTEDKDMDSPSRERDEDSSPWGEAEP